MCICNPELIRERFGVGVGWGSMVRLGEVDVARTSNALVGAELRNAVRRSLKAGKIES